MRSPAEPPATARPKALVLGWDNGSFLGVIRSLGRRGIEVHVGWCPPEAPAAVSRYVHRVHQLPRPSRDGQWTDAFTGLMRQERFDLVLPTNDPTLIPLQLARERLEPFGRLYLLDDRAFEITFDKVKTRELALANDVPVAPGHVVSGPGEIDAVLEACRYPLVIRPQASFNLDDLEQRNSVRRVYSEGEAREAISELLRRGLVLAEENILGVGWGVEVLARDGEILLSQQHERLHEPLHGGASSYRRTVSRDSRFMDAVVRLVRSLDYTGVAMFEFKGDPVTGPWVLVEINSRFWGSLPLSLAAGIDFPYALWQLLVDGAVDVPDAYRTDVYARNLKRDLKWMWVNLRADRKAPDLATQPLSRLAGEVSHVLTLREHTDQFTLDDPWPGLAEFRDLGVGFLDFARARLIVNSRVRRLHRRRAREALGQASTILFVSHGDVCRSPFACSLARRLLPGEIEVISAATCEDDGRRSPAVACTVAREFGVDLEDHRSHAASGELIQRADAIFVFDQRDRREVRRRFPRARSKVHLIGALGDGPLHVEDPINRSERDFRRIYGAIAHALARGAAAVPGSPSGADGSPVHSPLSATLIEAATATASGAQRPRD